MEGVLTGLPPKPESCPFPSSLSVLSGLSVVFLLRVQTEAIRPRPLLGDRERRHRRVVLFVRADDPQLRPGIRLGECFRGDGIPGQGDQGGPGRVHNHTTTT